MDSGRRTPRMVSKSPVRSRYTDATKKSPIRERNSGASALIDFDGANVGIGRKTPTRTNKSPLRPRYEDASRKTPTRERNLGSSDVNRKSPLPGRTSGDFDPQSKPSRRSTDADNRKSPLRKSVVANKEEIQENVKKFVSVTESFNGWLPGVGTADQNQIEVNKPSASPRKRRTWGSEDPLIGFDIKQRPGPISEIPNRIDDEHDNVYGRRHAEVSHDDWVEEDDYGGARRNIDVRYKDRYVKVLERPRGRMEQWEAERVGFRGVGGNGKPRHRVPIESHEPPSNYRSGYNYGYDELRGSRSRYNGPANLQNVAIKQAGILRMYDELGVEIGRMGDLSYSQGGRGEFYDDTDDYVHDEFVRVRRGTVQSSGHNGSPRMMRNFVSNRPIPSGLMPNEFPFHDDPSSPRIPLRTTPNKSHHYQQQYGPRRPVESTYDPITEYKTLPNRQTRPAPDYNDAYGKPSQESASRNPTPNNPSSRSRSSADSKSDGGSLAHDHAMKLLVVNQNQQLCHPIAGGAPFVICSKCSKLLRLPKKVRTMKKNQCKVHCGSCRTISSFYFNKKKSDVSFQTNFKSTATDVPIELVSKSDDKNHGHNSVAGMANRESFHFNKMRPALSPSSSSSSHASKDDKSVEAVGQTDSISSKEEKPPLTNAVLPLRPPPCSPLRYHMDYSDILAAERDGSSLNYAEIAAIPTKLNRDSDEDPKNVASQGSIDVPIRKDQGFQDPYLPSLRASPAIPNVYVNGQPITRDAVRSAEKLAGTISGGAYWYDKRAGFWGIMGNHCLGIIAPFIEEFRAQMPENCSGGDTCIYVNGRELHKHDLDTLSGRGLPRTRYKYYVVDLSGKVEDEDTGRFVVNIGKLAPNVERTGRGFGMHPPEKHNG
ncbi:hypothetical protein V2J09_022492 [Rumex salicifolius]